MQDNLEHRCVASESIHSNGNVHPVLQHDADSNKNLTSPATSLTHTSMDDNDPHHTLQEGTCVEESTAIIQPEETHAYLSKDHSIRITGKPVVRAKRDNVSVLTKWWYELVSLAAAIAALIAIVITMAEYDNKEQPKWKYSINLSTLIAILATMLRACMVVVAEEVISQLKWLLFRRPQPLQHLAHFDTAARGPWGSLLLFFRTRSLDTALVGCIVILLSVGIGPFSQQAVKSVSCERPLEGAEASIRVSRWMHDLNTTRIHASHWDLDLDAKVAILDGLVNPNTTRSNITPSCSTGNCVFPSHNGVTHSSVGLCKKCVDTSDWLREGELEAQFDGTSLGYNNQWIWLPDGHGIGGMPNGSLPKTIISVSGRSNIWRDQRSVPLNKSLLEAFDGSFDGIFAASILNVSVVAFTNNGCEHLAQESGLAFQRCPRGDANRTHLDFLNTVATTCSFHPCVRDYYGSVRNTIFAEKVVNETPISQPPGQVSNSFPKFLHLHTPCVIEDQIYTIENISSVPREGHNFTSNYVNGVNMTFPMECAYGTTGVYAMSLGEFMVDAMMGNCSVPPRISFNGDADDYNALVCSPWQIKTLVNKGLSSFESIDRNMESVATAVTSEMRKQGSDYSQISHSPIFVKGTVVRSTTCTKFEWIWLSFPLVLTVLTILLFCVMCGKTLFDKRRVPTWKSSILPLLLAGHQLGAVVAAEDIDHIKSNTDPLVVRLVQDERGWEFAIEDKSETSRDH